jgi:hypothetical protein
VSAVTPVEKAATVRKQQAKRRAKRAAQRDRAARGDTPSAGARPTVPNLGRAAPASASSGTGQLIGLGIALLMITALLIGMVSHQRRQVRT